MCVKHTSVTRVANLKIACLNRANKTRMRLHLEKYTGKSMTVRNYECFYLARAYLVLLG